MVALAARAAEAEPIRPKPSRFDHPEPIYWDAWITAAEGGSALHRFVASDTVWRRADPKNQDPPPRRGGRVVEGARLESVYTVMSRIVGSNPTPSANKSLNSWNLRSGFELPVRFAAVCGPLHRAAARTGPRERGGFVTSSIAARIAPHGAHHQTVVQAAMRHAVKARSRR